ncbi:hypothetical protein D3C76_1138760 [compost metagenome]
MRSKGDWDSLAVARTKPSSMPMNQARALSWMTVTQAFQKSGRENREKKYDQSNCMGHLDLPPPRRDGR